MKYIRKLFRLLSTLSFVILIVYGLVHVPELFGLHKLVMEKDYLDYPKDSIVYYYDTDVKNIGAGDVVTFKKGNEIMLGSIRGISSNEFKVNTGSGEEPVSASNILGKNINIVIKFLGPCVVFITNNLVMVLIVLLSFIILNFVLRVLYKNKDNVDKKEVIENNLVEDNKEHKKVLEIDE